MPHEQRSSSSLGRSWSRVWRAIDTAVRQPDDPRVLEEQSRTLLLRSKTLCWLALGVIAFTILAYDAAFFPDRLRDGLILTVLANGAVGALLVAHYRGWFDRRPAVAFVILLGVICNATEAAQLVITGGPTESTFFFPYYLIFFGIATFFPASTGAVILACLLQPVGYLTAGVLTGEDLRSVAFVSNVILLVDYAAITVIANRVVAAIFFREVRLRLEIEEANEKLRELDRMKTEFFANVSHELRTPLTLILGPATTLLGRDPGALGDAERDLVRRIRRNASRLLTLINDLLLLSKLESGRLEAGTERVDLSAVVREATDSMQPYADPLNLTLVAEAPPDPVDWAGSRQHVERVLINLISNACKFSRPGGEITVRLARDGSRLLLSVADQGIGISASDLPTLFDRFVQVDSAANRQFEGTGIGLSIVKELTELYGGTVEVASALGEGSTFSIRLPERTPSHDPDRPSPTAPPSSAQHEDLMLDPPPIGAANDAAPPPALPRRPTGAGAARVFVVEDNADLLDYMAQELSRYYRIIPYQDPAQALHDALQAPPDLIVSDVMMPGLDGIALARKLRMDSATRDVPILLLSARDDVDTKLQGFEAGVDDFVSKPFQLPELRARIDAHLRLRRQAAELTRSVTELDHALTQLRGAEAAIVHHEKMALLGRVVAGVAHETNNPLHFLRGNVGLLKQELERFEPDAKTAQRLREILEDVDASMERIGAVTQQLVRFGRSDGSGTTDVPVRDVMDLVVKMLKHRASAGVRIVNAVGDDTVHANPQELFQIALNVVHNAIQAVNGAGGEVRIETEPINGMTEIRFVDNGGGIPADVRDRVFEPFFTTKPPGEGTGLGLSIVSNLVANQQGTIEIDSEPGTGTTVFVRLRPGGVQ